MVHLMPIRAFLLIYIWSKLIHARGILKEEQLLLEDLICHMNTPPNSLAVGLNWKLYAQDFLVPLIRV